MAINRVGSEDYNKYIKKCSLCAEQLNAAVYIYRRQRFSRYISLSVDILFSLSQQFFTHCKMEQSSDERLVHIRYCVEVRVIFYSIYIRGLYFIFPIRRMKTYKRLSIKTLL